MSKPLVCFLIFSLALQTLLEALHKSGLKAFGAFLTDPNITMNKTEKDLSKPEQLNALF